MNVLLPSSGSRQSYSHHGHQQRLWRPEGAQTRNIQHKAWLTETKSCKFG